MPITLNQRKSAGWWIPGEHAPEKGDIALKQALLSGNQPVALVQSQDGPRVGCGGEIHLGGQSSTDAKAFPLLAYAPPLSAGDLGDPDFKRTYQLQYAYVAGAMANAITSVEMVEKMGKAGMIGFFGAAGLLPDQVAQAIDQLKGADIPFGMNLIHSPQDPALEEAIVALYLQNQVRNVSASAYLNLTLPLLRFRYQGIHQRPDSRIVCPNRIIAKVSRVEVADRFLSPPPDKLLGQLVEKGWLTQEEARLAQYMPVAEDMTAEADSGGHTDNRPALALLPTLIALRDALAEKYRYVRPPKIGLAGGIATPESAAAAFAMGAAYVLTGSVNQSCVEAGTSEAVRQMLAQAQQADVVMAPAADMFEMGVKVQVLKRGTMFSMRASKLYELYRRYKRYEDIPEKERQTLERDILRCSFEDAWQGTCRFFQQRDPAQIARGQKDPRHKMALVFRSYLGQSSGWAIQGEPSRQIDYQIWCGPALGAFNQWVKGSFLEPPDQRQVVTVAQNLLAGAAYVTRTGWLRQQGVALPPGVTRFSPMQGGCLAALMNP